jgi:hypothetical protein
MHNDHLVIRYVEQSMIISHHLQATHLTCRPFPFDERRQWCNDDIASFISSLISRLHSLLTLHPHLPNISPVLSIAPLYILYYP